MLISSGTWNCIGFINSTLYQRQPSAQKGQNHNDTYCQTWPTMIAASQGQPRSQTIVATPTPSRASGGGSRSSPNPQPTTGRTTPNPISSQPPAPTGQVTQQSPLLRFLLLTWLGNTIAAMGLLVAVASLILTTYSSVVQIAATKWSARNDAIQACLAAAVCRPGHAWQPFLAIC